MAHETVPEVLEEVAMRKIVPVLMFTILFVGCVTDGGFNKKTLDDGTCIDKSGYTYTGIAYGESKLMVIPLSEIRRNTEWRFYLLPIDNLGGATKYGESMVTIEGKSEKSSDDWIDASGKFNARIAKNGQSYIFVCVPETVEIEGEQVKIEDDLVFEFKVTVDSIGYLDPRARVIP